VPRAPFDDEGLKGLPAEPGVYVFLDEEEKPLYVGKAADLRSRTRAYLLGTDRRPYVPRIAARARTVDFVVTGSTKDALLLENNLIKRFAPRYNIRLRDDKTYFSLRLDLAHEWPRLKIVRRRKDDGALYFGPYVSASACRKTIQFLNTLYPIRTCPDGVLYNRTRPCLNHEIGRCVAPCVGLVSREDYRALIDKVARFLSGKDPDVAAVVEREMEAAAARLDFERAAELRDRLDDLRRTVERAAASRGGGVERDALAAAVGPKDAAVAVMHARGHVLLEAETFRVKAIGDEGEILSAFLGQYYGPGRPAPAEILLAATPPDLADHAAVFAERETGATRLLVPERGEGERLVVLARRNASLALKSAEPELGKAAQTLKTLRKALDLVHAPDRIECYDVSHLSGGEVVASGVAFTDGEPDPARYRRYRLREVRRNDDFAALEEVLRRRLKRGLAEGDLPDLVIVDGGRPQIRRAREVFRELKVGTVDLIGLAKARTGDRASGVFGGFERVVLPDRDEPVILPQTSPELLLLARIRDEAHRFAIEYGRRIRRKKAVGSVLELVPGIGPRLARALLKTYGDVARVKTASRESLAAVPGMTAAKAGVLLAFFADYAAAGGGAKDADEAAPARDSDERP
jgi:excinuclease ABC subunit C